MPTLAYILRRCGILKFCEITPSKLAFLLVPNSPSAGSSSWQPLHVNPVNVLLRPPRIGTFSPSAGGAPPQKTHAPPRRTGRRILRRRTGAGGGVHLKSKTVEEAMHRPPGWVEDPYARRTSA